MVNTSDRQIVNTGAQGPDRPTDYRVPEVFIARRSALAPPPSDPSVPGGQPPAPNVGVPRDITIESQTVRIQPDGSAVIDVEISFEPAESAVKHEVRLTKL